MSRRAWWGVAVAVALAAFAGARFLVRALDPLADWDVTPPRMPSDDELRTRWRARRDEFEALRALIAAEPKLTIVGEDRVEDCWRGADGAWGCPDAGGLGERAMLAQVGLPRERYAQYRARLSAVGATRVARTRSGVQMTIFSAGIVTSGTGKDLFWSPTPPAPLVPDTDRDRSNHFTINYARIADDWYIVHSSN